MIFGRRGRKPIRIPVKAVEQWKYTTCNYCSTGCAFAIVSTGQLLTEEFYTLGKLVRSQIGTNNYDGNTTLCMASAVSGYKRSFGSDGPPGCYEDFEKTHCLMAFGSNLPEQHPILCQRLERNRRRTLIVADPRVTKTA